MGGLWRRWIGRGKMRGWILLVGGMMMATSGPEFFPGKGSAAGGSTGDLPFLVPQKIGHWELEKGKETYGPENLFDYMDGAAELYLSYGFRSMRLHRYLGGDGSRVVVETYEMASSEDAYGIFSFEREDEDVGVGQGSELGGGTLRFWKGRYFVNVYGEKETSDEELVAIGKAIADSIRETGREPELIKFLPGESRGLIPGSVRFFRNHVCLNQRFFIANKNILLLDSTTSGLMAQMRTPLGKVQIILIDYPDEARAASADKSFRLAFMPEAQREGMIKTEDGKWTGAMRKGKLWIGVFGAGDRGQLQEIFRMVLERVEK